MRGWCLGQLGNTDQAIMDTNQAIEIAPGNHIHYGARADVYMLCKRFNEAIADFSLSIKLYSGSPEYSLIARNRIFYHW